MLKGHPAQLGLLDGAAYEPGEGTRDGVCSSGALGMVPGEIPGPNFTEVPHETPGAPLTSPGTLDDPLTEPEGVRELPAIRNREDRQLAFEFAVEGIQLGWDDWKQETAAYRRWLDGNTARAARIAACGSLWAVKKCHGCGEHDVANAVQSADCETGICPRCARNKSAGYRKKLQKAMTKAWPVQRRGKSWFMITPTVRRPRGTNVERLRADDAKLRKAIKTLWPWLKRHGAERAFVKREVGLGGMVHRHILVFMPWMRGQTLAAMRAEVVAVTGAPFVNVRRVRKGKTAAAEMSKYLCKGVARNDPNARQMHPLLSAMVDVAFKGTASFQWLGDWGKLVAVEDPEPSWACPHCGGKASSAVYMNAEQLAALRTARLPGECNADV